MKKFVSYLLSGILLTGLIFSCKSGKETPSKADYDAMEEISIRSSFQKGRTDFNAEESQVLTDLQNLVTLPLFASQFSLIPCVYVMVLDQNFKPTGAGITMKSDGKSFTVEKGYDTALEPFAVIGVNGIYAKTAVQIFEDGKLSDEEKFRISNLFFKTSMETFCNSKDIRYFTKIGRIRVVTPNFCTLSNPTGFPLKPEEDAMRMITVTYDPDKNRYSVVYGHQGNAKASYTFDSTRTWDYFTLVWDVLTEKDFNTKVVKFDKLQSELIKTAVARK
jgi:hypothetical protein